MMKRFQTIALDVLLLGEKETSKNKDQKTQRKIMVGSIFASTPGRKRLLSVFLKSF